MMANDILGRYTALTTTSERSAVVAVLTSIILAPASTFDAASRGTLIKQILEDFKSIGKGRLIAPDAAKALLAVKTLGREYAGSEVIAQNLPSFLKLQTTLKEYPDAANEALRCIANALLLVESARSAFLEPDVNGAAICIPMLDRASTPDQIFILSRVLFLAAASGSSRIQELVENKYNGRYLVDILVSKIDSLVSPAQSAAPMAREAMSDLLKFAFHLLVHYPKLVETEPQGDRNQGDDKVMGDFWSSKLDGLLLPTIKVFLALSPMSPCPIAAPLSHTIHALISFPVSSSLKPTWFPQPSTSGRSSASSTPKSSLSRTPLPETSQPTSRSHSPGRSSPTSPKPSTLERAISVLSAGRRSLSRSRPSSPAVTKPMAVVDKALELLDATLSRYFPGKIESDDPSVNQKLKADGQDSLDDVLPPLNVLLTRLCIGDETARARIRQYIAPDNLDRSSTLEDREDILGRCLRLLGSVYHAQVKKAVGEMLYAMCDSNPTTMSGLLGYGNVAGFLFNKGVLSAPTGDSNAPTTDSKGEIINPITGTTVQPKSNVPDMTDEEKEAEMEKLLVLFDRLEKTGALPKDQNPIRKAIHEGKLPTS